jgi:isopentenyl phosphate kinase
MLLRIPIHTHPSPSYRTIQYEDEAEVQIIKREVSTEIGVKPLWYFDVMIQEQEGYGILRAYTSALYTSEDTMNDEIVAMILRSEGKLESKKFGKFKKRGRR